MRIYATAYSSIPLTLYRKHTIKELRPGAILMKRTLFLSGRAARKVRERQTW